MDNFETDRERGLALYDAHKYDYLHAEDWDGSLEMARLRYQQNCICDMCDCARKDVEKRLKDQ